MSDSAPPATRASLTSNIATKIAQAIENIMTLRVTTVVGLVQVKSLDDSNGRTRLDFPNGPDNRMPDCATTSINLVGGDITQVRSPIFVTDPTYAKIHDDALIAARAIVSDNLAALQSAIVGLEKFLSRQS